MATEETSLLRHRPHGPPARPPTKHVLAVIASSWIATFLAAADTTITATLSSTIASEFDSMSLISWLGTAYLIGLTIIQPLSGKLSDIFGRRTSFVFTACMFTIGNLLCGIARSKGLLIAARVVAGIGGGGCISISTFIISDNVPLKARGSWQGVASLVFTSGVGAGGVIGGVVSDLVGWRWAFLGIAPVAMVSCVLVAALVPAYRTDNNEGMRARLARVDFAGSCTLIASLALLLVGLNEGKGEGGTSTSTLRHTIPLSILFFALFLLIEHRWAREPIIPLSLFRRRTVTATCLTAYFFSGALYILLYYVPLYMQTTLAHSSSETGLRIIAYSIGSAIASLFIGTAMRVTDNKHSLLFIHITQLCMVIAAAGFTQVGVGTHWIVPEIYLFIQGVAVGGGLTTLVVALLHAVPHGMHATATAAFYAFRSVGSTVGLAGAGAVFHALIRPDNSDNEGSRVDGGEYLDALHGAFWTATGCAGAGLVCGFMISSSRTVNNGDEEE
ncbi:major facilitator superfamily domain-containing protein [Aspergillus venezuelensis]